ncbi:MAG: hypothetical protein CVV23_00690 [Ignavibacteriae bacterium HGW-Ignavibacteriae-2]|jgi:DNA-binding MarR family transcriptional regulator|nr:MarR family transcriptional regulator [Bacteroidota bacterium]PKL90401.1 MAG: hypothetical protein CVV23_00690 [Ignavibacteriae bacterium HGW-Ignavibacteriae-2]
MHTDHKQDKLAEAMADLTCELARTCNEKENYFASLFNLTPAEFKCLKLFSKTNSITIKTISVLMKLTPGRITHILTSLEKKKFIKRKTDHYDKRNVIVSLTSNSEPFLKNLNCSHIKLHQEILENISAEKREEIIYAMQQVVDALRTWSAKIE